MIETTLVASDLQIPFHDQRAIDVMCDFTVKGVKLDRLVVNGDGYDCFEISDYDRNPRAEQILEREIREGEKVLAQLALVAPSRMWLGGNHEDRWRRFQWRKAPQLAGMESFEFPEVFKLTKHGFGYKPYGASVNLGKLVVTHGFLVRNQSGVTGRATFERLGTSCLIGHTHRLGAWYLTDMRGPHVAYENGCLCKLKAEWVQHANWQQGFSIVHHDTKSGLFNVQQVPILPGKKFWFGDKLYGGK